MLKELSPNFWLHKALAEMTSAEWEALCDGCGKCCLHKLVEEVDDESSRGNEGSSEGVGEGFNGGVGEGLTDGLTEAISEGLYMSATERLYYTDIHCAQLDPNTGHCQCYAKRLETVATCVNITLADLPRIHFMPSSCAYRRLHEGRGLADWHPLLHNGSQAAMLAAGHSVRSYPTMSERDIDEDDFELRIVTWPLSDG